MGLVEQVREAGVVGAGGAGFPTYVKVSARVDTIIANGAECEPLLVTDQWVMYCHAEEIAFALRQEALSVGAERVVLAIKKKYHSQFEGFKYYLEGKPKIEIFLLDDVYPSGDEQFLVHEVTSRIVPEGGIPLDVNCVVQNVSTLYNIFNAIQGKPVILKHVTVAGEVQRPGVYIVPIGTSVAEVIQSAGGSTIKDFKVIEGGPMMGFVVKDFSSPVTKTTSGYLVLPSDLPLVARLSTTMSTEFQRGMAVCCQCRTCTEMCPRYLLGHRIQPHLAMRAILAGTSDALDTISMGYLCCLCGVCESYACPMTLSPRRVFGAFKQRLQQTKTPNPYRARPDKPRDGQAWVRVPKTRLTQRLGLMKYVIKGEGTPIPISSPHEVRIPLKQHIGAPCIPMVKVGERVSLGQRIGDIPPQTLGAPIHASIDGIVRKIDEKEIIISRG